ncbi:MAG: hypothetical protein ACRCZR_04990 [Cetobacterium sp.]
MEDNVSLAIFYERLSDEEKNCLSAILELEEEKYTLANKTDSKIVDDIKKIIEGEIK